MSKDLGLMALRRRSVPKQRSGKKRVTMRLVARLAGNVHPSTVSLALRNHSSISLATRKYIQAVAKKAGYRRDPLLDAFNDRRLGNVAQRVQVVIAFVADFESRRALEESPQHAALWRGASTAAEALHCRVEFFAAGKGHLTAERLDSILHARSIDCLVAAALPAGLPRLDMKWDRYCAAKINCFDWDAPGYTVAGDLRQGARLAVSRLRDLGYGRIGLVINRVEEERRNDLLMAGYLVENDRMHNEPTIPPLSVVRAPDARALGRWIRRHRIDAVISDHADFGDLVLASRSVVDGKLPWTCLDVTNARAGVAGVVMPHERIGALAVEQVVNLSRANQRGVPHSASFTFVPVGWRDGASLSRCVGR